VRVEAPVELRGSEDRPAVGLDDHVPDPEPALLAGAAGNEVANDEALGPGQAEPARERRRDLLDPDPDHASVHVPLLPQAAIRHPDDGRGQGEAEPLVPAGLAEDEGVDADETAAHVHEGAAAVAGIDGRVGLDVDDRRVLLGLSGHGADHAHGHGVVEAERAADGEHDLALGDILEVGEAKGGKACRFHLEQRQVEVVREAHDRGGQRLLLTLRRQRRLGVRRGAREDDLHALRALHDVGVRDDVPGRIEDDARADALLAREHGGLPARAAAQRAVARRDHLDHGR
jgi:hypothetical protein